MAHDDLSKLLGASVELTELRKHKAYHEDRAQQVFDEMCERLLKARARNYAKRTKMASELIQLGWDMAMNTDSLCEQYGEALDEASDRASERMVGG
jgi:hypothetical protein